MSARSHNIAVGLTVLVALALLGGMILMFAGMPEALRGGYQLRVHMNDSGGAKKGDTVSLLGQSAGKITDIRFAGADPREGVELVLHIDKGIDLPTDTVLTVSQSFMGGPSVSLNPGSAKQFVPTDNSGVIKGQAYTIDVGKLTSALAGLTEGMGSLLGVGPSAGKTATGPGTSTTAPGSAPPNLQTTIARLDVTLGALNEMLANKDNQDNIKLTLKNLKDFTATGTQTMEEIKKLAIAAQTTVVQADKTIGTIGTVASSAGTDMDRLTQALLKDAESASHALSSLDQALILMSQGQGTTGKLINDPHLYNNLVDIADQMSSLMKETRELLQQWKEKGVPLKLK